jgi:K+-sensing histidine kinase KdpD
MKTYHAPPERSGNEELLNQRSSLESISFIKELIDALPYIALILNENRQIIFSNESLIKQIELKDFQEFLGKAPGEILNCVNAKNNEAGCGTSEKCRYCGSVNSILTSLKDDCMISDEFRMIADNDGTEVAYDYMVTSSPFRWKDDRFLIFTLTDISSKKRQRLLERIFFHDILNTAGNIKGLSELILQIEDQKKKESLLKIIGNLSLEIVEEIEAQKQLSSAESGDIILRNDVIDSKEIIETVIDQFENYSKKKCFLKIDKESENITFTADRSLIIRIIKNMVINALEASLENETIILLAKRIDPALRFEVKNPSYISRNVQMQLFNRSFSTKGLDRGLGTYSMKLLGERYLKGKVYFTTSKEAGTSFFFDFPLS